MNTKERIEAIERAQDNIFGRIEDQLSIMQTNDVLDMYQARIIQNLSQTIETLERWKDKLKKEEQEWQT